MPSRATPPRRQPTAPAKASPSRPTDLIATITIARRRTSGSRCEKPARAGERSQPLDAEDQRRVTRPARHRGTPDPTARRRRRGIRYGRAPAARAPAPPMISGQRLNLATRRCPLGLDQTPAVDLLTGLFGERRQHRDGARSASDGDRQTGRHEVAERVVEIVGEAPEHESGSCRARADGEAPHVRPDRRASTLRPTT